MRILFFGTPAYALPSLQRLAAEHEIAGVVSQPDRRSGRHRKPVPPPVAAFARDRDLRLIQPGQPRGRAFLNSLAELQPELSVVIAYGHILKPSVIDLPELGTVNAHGSLLPAYRGAAPAQRAILAGETETGVTVQRMVPAMDAGAVILAERTLIGPEETSGELLARLSELSAECLSRALKLIASGEARPVEQDESRVTLAPKLSKEEGRANWARPAEELARAARAYNPWPALQARLPGGRGLKILRARAEPGEADPGAVTAAEDADFLVGTGEGLLRLLEVQAEGKRAMTAGDFLRGAHVAAGDRLE
ncbi:MAG: methionyl-tRNA formyltransferase [Planctomycetota bacterium]|jgi:methionyl-tRNA formyltransferase